MFNLFFLDYFVKCYSNVSHSGKEKAQGWWKKLTYTVIIFFIVSYVCVFWLPMLQKCTAVHIHKFFLNHCLTLSFILCHFLLQLSLIIILFIRTILIMFQGVSLGDLTCTLVAWLGLLVSMSQVPAMSWPFTGFSLYFYLVKKVDANFSSTGWFHERTQLCLSNFKTC